MTESPTTYVAYASFGARLRALVIDAAIVAAWMVFLVVGGDVAREVPGAGRVTVALLLAVVFFYEPVQVWRWGATIGHRTANVRVVADSTGGNPGFARALARFLIKSVLGIVSFVAMAVTRRHQAVHDSLTGTTVQIRDFHRARVTDFAFERVADPVIRLPSRARRFAIVLAFLVAAFVIMSVLMVVLVTPACLDEIACTAGEMLIVDVISLSWLAASVIVIIAGWRGRLWGARATRDAGTGPADGLDSTVPDDVPNH
jgi:uncharacterized RDD family membrane protein YckC